LFVLFVIIVNRGDGKIVSCWMMRSLKEHHVPEASEAQTLISLRLTHSQSPSPSPSSSYFSKSASLVFVVVVVVVALMSMMCDVRAFVR
jgi:hypothetical protein